MPIKSLLKPEIKKWLTKSGQSELYAHHLYIHLANELQRLGFFGTQKFFENESSEELKHYYIIRNYVNDMGDVLNMPTLEECNDKVSNIGDALQIYYDTELDLMEHYKDFYKQAEKNDDCITSQFILQFLEIQRKSVGEAGDFLQRYQQALVGKEILEFDEHMSE